MVHFHSCPRCNEQALYMPQVCGGFTCFNCGLKVGLDGETNDPNILMINALRKENAELKELINTIEEAYYEKNKS